MIEPSAKIILDSVSSAGHRLTTMEITCHRFVLAEFNTHRMFSRNSASSRAIPVVKQLDRVRETPAYPLVWPAEQKGMQGGAELREGELNDAQWLFDEIREHTVRKVTAYVQGHAPEQRLHKSLLNRLLEPFMWHTIIVSATEWENFFRQRCSPLAQPEIRAVAELMQKAYKNSTPQEVGFGGWHTPYMDDEDFKACGASGEDPRHVSAARCARVSYLTHDGKRDVQLDADMFNRLRDPGEGPPHASPLEHVATPCRGHVKVGSSHQGNFHGWDQLRHQVLGF